ncbi:MAG: Pimeloyl-ACP methyl ester carboxylesterase [Phenylobacterium sp.]|nr:Pimeloyl-ACP methyl ester carboxylesterase [Phenylobacterium sp.]
MQRRDLLLSALTAGAALGAGRSALAMPPLKISKTAPNIKTRDGVALFHREWGAGRPVVLVHSWALSSTMWGHQVGALSDAGYRCVAFDRRGHGRSEASAAGYDMDTLADDLDAVIETLRLRDVILIGHSMGGGEIVRYLGRHGGARISKVVLLAPMTPFLTKTGDNPYGVPKEYFAARQAEWTEDFPKWVEENKAPFFTADTSPSMINWMMTELLRADVPTAVACIRSLTETDLRPDLAKIDRPVLILHGDKDVSAPLEITGRRTVAGIRGAALKVYAGAPHGLFITHAKQVNQDILSFLAA